MRQIALALAALLAVATAHAQPKPEAVLRKETGNEYLKQRQYAKARDEYLAALKVDPSYEDAHYNLGVVYFFRLQDYPRALYHLATYARLAKDAPDLAQVKSLVSQALEKVEEPEREAYGKALAEGTPAAVRAYVERYPQSPYVADARVKLRLLEAYEEQVRQQGKAVETAFGEALAKGTPEALDAFLAAHPAAPQAADAKRRRDQWADDERAMKAAVEAGTVEALDRFVAERPQSPYAARARAKADGLKAAEQAFQAAVAARSAAALEEFLKAYPGTPREAEAKKALGALRAAEAEQKARDAAAPVPAAPVPVPAAPVPVPAAPVPVPAAPVPVPAAPVPVPAASVPVPAAPVPAAEGAPADAAAPELLTAEEQLKRDWTAAKAKDTQDAYTDFLKAHPEGEEAEAARKRLEELATPFTPLQRNKVLERYRRMIQGK